jgi:hypothetical protein
MATKKTLRRVKLYSEQPCINPNCTSRGDKRLQRARGLCEACYRAMDRAIKAGTITAEQAVARGMMRSAIPPSSRRFPDLYDAHGNATYKVSIKQVRGVRLKKKVAACPESCFTGEE